MPKGQQNRLIFEGARAIFVLSFVCKQMALAPSKNNRFFCHFGMLRLVYSQQNVLNNFFFYGHFEISTLSFSVKAGQNISIF